MNFEQPARLSPRQKYEKANKSVRVEQVGLEKDRERRDKHLAEFRRDFKDSPISGILTVIDLLPANLDVALSKWRLRSAEKTASGMMGESQQEANELNQRYEELKEEVVKAGGNFKEAVKNLADFETSSLGMKNKSTESSEVE